MTTKMLHRKADHAIDPVYLERWSPRAFSTRPVEEEKLNSIFEAARWAPSANNLQPWRFIVGQTEEERKAFLSVLFEGNVAWCERVPVFVAVVSKTTVNEEGDKNPFYSFDTGAAWGFLALEAYRQGLITHGMGGFDREKAREVLNIPDEYDIEAIIAVGYHDPEAPLPEQLQEREKPSARKPIEEFVFKGSFKE